MCKRMCEIVLAIILIVGGALNLSPMVHKWLLLIVGVILLVHAFLCRNCCGGECEVEHEGAKVRKRK